MSDELKNESLNGANEQAMTPSCPNGQLYTVKSGDTMFAIARRSNIPLQRLIDANPQIADPNVIMPGQMICIPGSGPVISCPGGQIYKVVRGDTMYEIARRYGISLDALVRANPQIKDPSEIFPGQEICIPGTTPVTCPGGTLYTVKAGDTMYQIAQRNRISLAALVAANPQITNPDRIFPGQMICIPAGTVGEMPPMAPPEMPGVPPVEHPVTPPVTILPTPVAPPEMPMPGSPPATIMPMPMLGSPPATIMPMPMPGCPPATSMPMPMPMTPPVTTLPAMDRPIFPCPARYGQMPMSTMPMYVVVPWDECPYRCKGKRDRRNHHHNRHCR